MNPADIQEHMLVVGSDGEHVGTVDHMEGSDRIKLIKRDPVAAGKHHFIPLSWVERVDDKVHLNMTTPDALAHWEAES